MSLSSSLLQLLLFEMLFLKVPLKCRLKNKCYALYVFCSCANLNLTFIEHFFINQENICSDRGFKQPDLAPLGNKACFVDLADRKRIVRQKKSHSPAISFPLGLGS